MKTLFYCLLSLLSLASCGQKEITLSDANCLIVYHEEYGKIAKDIQLEEQLMQVDQLEKTQHSYSILNVGDAVEFTLPYPSDGENGLVKAQVLASYYQKAFFKDKQVSYSFKDDSKNLKLKILSSELPSQFEQFNFSLYVDHGVNPKDLKKLETFSKDKTLPQEARFWLKIGDDNTYYCYTIFNNQTEDPSILQHTFSSSSDVVKKLNELNLTKKVEPKFMDLNYEILDFGI